MSTVEKKLFTGMIPVAKPWFTEREEILAAEAIRSGWVAQGPKVKEFEKAVADYVGVPYAIAANSCTSALQVVLEAMGVGPGDEVIVPSFTFVATANVVVHVGARPVFVDIDPVTYNMDPKLLEKLITPRTKVIMPVDQIGLPADLDLIIELSKRKNLRVLEDAACSLGSWYKGKKIGSLSEATCLSFHPRKLITTGEGGMILTADRDLAEACRVKVSHGASVSDLVRHNSSKIMFEEYHVFGHNYRMSDIQAAVGLGQLEKLEEILRRKRHFSQRYNQAFSGLKEVVCPSEPQGVQTNFQSYMVRIRPEAKRSRDEIMQFLLERKISTRRGIMAIHEEPSYVKAFGKISLPETEKALRETIILPLYPQMTVEEQDYVIEHFKEALLS